MIFVIDIGNTNVCLAGVEGDCVIFKKKISTDSSRSREEYFQEIRSLIGEPAQFEGAILSSVVPQVADKVEWAVSTLFGKPPIIVSKDIRTGLDFQVDFPEKVGRDRIADSVWAAEHYPLPVVTADLGTATTLNVILPGRIFAGGSISAGIQTGLKALGAGTAQLPKLQLNLPKSVIGRNTEACMITGAVIGTAGLVDGIVSAIEKELDQSVTLLLTGGGGEYVSPYLKHPHIYDPDMILKGIALLYRMNQSQ